MANTESAVAVIEQDAESGMVAWNLDGFPEGEYNRLLPVATLQIPTDLLRPVVQIVKLNPDPKAGDVYSSGDMPEGHAAPTRVGLRKFATAAGISFIDERRVDDGRDPDVIEVSTVAEMLMPTGQRIRATGTKRIDLNAQVWRSDAHRGKFKSFFQEHVASRAQNRAIRALLSLRGSYPAQVYAKPFAVVSFAPNMAHPEVRSRILDAMAPVAAQLYGGGPAAKQLEAGATVNVTPAPEEDPAPATPTVLPGETLAKATEPEEPAWMQAAAERKPAKAEPDFLTAMRSASDVDGGALDASAEDIDALRDLLRPLGGQLVAEGLAAIWGESSVQKPTKGQARAIRLVHDNLGAEAFATAWKKVAELAPAGAAA